ncbi:MAG: hypothetical protein N7Q72_03675 [Spiroplasma sp. Tabriz.8]|nr:hypothetical protein [Spiroplasma sp. Tabriz.8]
MLFQNKKIWRNREERESYFKTKKFEEIEKRERERERERKDGKIIIKIKKTKLPFNYVNDRLKN